ncbi:MAG: pyridoxamine 5'-phosphate oxidase family protein [Desulfobacterales bacterium]
MNDEDYLKSRIKQLCESQRLGVLSTQYHGHPYSSLVAFSMAENLEELYFATARTTRKFRNLSQDNRVSMLIDNRSNDISDFHHAMAVTVLGTATELNGIQKEKVKNIHLIKHPYLEDFVSSRSCGLVLIQVEKYVLVRRFQLVFELHMKK